jgi:hypothetical protein
MPTSSVTPVNVAPKPDMSRSANAIWAYPDFGIVTYTVPPGSLTAPPTIARGEPP